MQVSDIDYHAPLGKSDHNVLTFDFHCYLDYSKEKECFLYNKGDYNGMRAKLVNSGWATEFIRNTDTVEEKWKDMKDMLLKLGNEFIPKRKISGKPNWGDRGNFPIDHEAREAISNKNKAYRDWVASTEESKDKYRPSKLYQSS